MIAENTRFVNAYQVTKNFVDDGVLGDILFARTYIGGMDPFIGAHVNGEDVPDLDNWRNFRNKAGGGAVFDGGCTPFICLNG